ncbi:MAG: 1-deoxy-D-xylulose-5-phosphate reductoisomerase [Candidatus Improbicoccus pseudotrichonymphae]|uniref:1-deoxy-D-xylulose 5-phosphate reductoisomerase n=1 Tax=Candidatus Improbicoccus pseudotrichonymphae TaxID=3033792 RepID=A0AA48I893_9FIRM|nr:MAG: 1-deoxy-D-xylulose-5-phosphate reductoisomerase [Candidatus Improbicoccus pseudotrichonymphae]
MNLVILGSTGFIGRKTIDVVLELNKNVYKEEKIRIVGISAGNNIELLEKQILFLSNKGLGFVCVKNLSDKKLICEKYKKISFFHGDEGLCYLVSLDSVNKIVNGLSGFSGLKPTFEAARKGKKILLANKETIISSGGILLDIIKKNKAELYPIDSEHSAIWRCLKGHKKQEVNRLILTASGGPFKNQNYCELENVTAKQALNHPKWKMGEKISIDSATMANKGFEIIEACYFFNMRADKIETIIHQESVIHSMIEFVDGSISSHMSMPDMKVPIQYALTYPDCEKIKENSVDFKKINKLTFEEINSETKEFLEIFKSAIKFGSMACCALCTADEEAVKAFLNGRIKFTDIRKILRLTMEKNEFKKINSLEELIEANIKFCETTKKMINSI